MYDNCLMQYDRAIVERDSIQAVNVTLQEEVETQTRKKKRNRNIILGVSGVALLEGLIIGIIAK